MIAFPCGWHRLLALARRRGAGRGGLVLKDIGTVGTNNCMGINMSIFKMGSERRDTTTLLLQFLDQLFWTNLLFTFDLEKKVIAS